LQSSAEKAQAAFDKEQEKSSTSVKALDGAQMQEYTRLKQLLFSQTANVQSALEANGRQHSNADEKLRSLKAKASDVTAVKERQSEELAAYNLREASLLQVISTAEKQRAASERELEQGPVFISLLLPSSLPL
jgi:chromosome segregation ATPase